MRGGIFMDHFHVYKDIEARTGGEIYVGVVGPVRTGKSTFIKRFMELLVLPNLPDGQKKAQTRDELPQSAAGKTIMTTEPKFIRRRRRSWSLRRGSGRRCGSSTVWVLWWKVLRDIRKTGRNVS